MSQEDEARDENTAATRDIQRLVEASVAETVRVRVQDAGAVGASGKAYQSVAQATAIAVQDATDHLRNIMTVSTTAIGAALANSMLQYGETRWSAVDEASAVVSKAARQRELVDAAASQVLRDYEIEANQEAD